MDAKAAEKVAEKVIRKAVRKVVNMKQHRLQIPAAVIVLVLWLCVAILGQRGRYDFDGNRTIVGALDVEGVTTITGMATGALADYDLCVGDTATPDYGMIQFGNACVGRTSYDVGNVDLNGTVLFRNLGGPVSGKIEFLWEEGNGNTRFAMPSSGVGNATYNPRSMLIAGPAPADTDMVTVGYWQTNNSIFTNLACDTAGDGADLGVQNDLEVMGDIFAAGLPVHADNAAAVTGGRAAGQFYRTGGDPDLVCIVH